MASKNVKAATPADVRTWAAAQGLSGFGSRGRISAPTIEAFNKAHKGKSQYAGKPEATVTVKGLNVSGSGRKTPVTRVVKVADVRAIAQGKRGRFSQADLLTAANLV